ncbi:uncharacterized protein LOC135360330 [Latimeria chalumnae]|uniref:uncharacterized protein LOC135360330 n=1 Tax=Latimeria chalumnae TaxID=7897 RepID=UPI00313D9032
METFFKRHFKKKHVSSQRNSGECCRHQRPGVAVPTGKARRRSSAGLPSVMLTQHRRSSTQLQGLPLARGGGPPGRSGRRRSSTTTPCLNPRFSVRRRGWKLRTIDTHLLGPSMLLASLIRMTEEEEEEERKKSSPAAKAAGAEAVATPEDSEVENSGSQKSDGSGSSPSEDSWSEVSCSECHEEEGAEAGPRKSYLPGPSETTQGGAMVENLYPRPLIRAPRCLRRNSSHLLPAEFVYSSATCGLYGYYRRRSSDLLHPAGPRGFPAASKPSCSRQQCRALPPPASSKQNSVPSRRLSVTAHCHCAPRRRKNHVYRDYYSPADLGTVLSYVQLHAT